RLLPELLLLLRGGIEAARHRRILDVESDVEPRVAPGDLDRPPEGNLRALPAMSIAQRKRGSRLPHFLVELAVDPNLVVGPELHDPNGANRRLSLLLLVHRERRDARRPRTVLRTRDDVQTLSPLADEARHDLDLVGLHVVREAERELVDVHLSGLPHLGR